MEDIQVKAISQKGKNTNAGILLESRVQSGWKVGKLVKGCKAITEQEVGKVKPDCEGPEHHAKETRLP